MIRSTLIFFTFIFLTSFLSIKKQEEFKSILIGKKVAETPLSEHIASDVNGDQLIFVIAYGCPHCEEATKKAIKLKKDHLIDDLIVLGSEAGETDAKKTFLTNLGDTPDFKIIDYDWANFPRKFTSAETGFPNPPVIFYVRNNVIKKIMTEIPSTASFKKLKEKIK